MYDLDYDAAMLELLRMFLTFLSGLVLASCMVILTWYLLLRAFLRDCIRAVEPDFTMIFYT